MFKKLKQKSIQKRTDKNLNTRDLSGVNAPAKSLGLLVDEVLFQDFDRLNDYSKFLGFQPRNVKVFSFIEFKKKAPSLRQNQISNKDFSWDGTIDNLNAKEFLNHSFDRCTLFENRHVHALHGRAHALRGRAHALRGRAHAKTHSDLWISGMPGT